MYGLTYLTTVYGGVMDVVLSLYPWTVVRNLQLQKRERLGVAITMGLGALFVPSTDRLWEENFANNRLSTGIIVILRSVLQFKKLVGRFGKQHNPLVIPT